MEEATHTSEYQMPESKSELVPVSWVGRDAFPLTDLSAEPEEFFEWGEFMAPFSSASISLHKVYVDTRIEGWYLMWIGNAVEEWEFKVVAWTPKVNGDSIVKAGYRMFSTVARTIEEFFQDDLATETELDYTQHLFSSERCQEVFSGMRSKI